MRSRRLLYGVMCLLVVGVGWSSTSVASEPGAENEEEVEQVLVDGQTGAIIDPEAGGFGLEGWTWDLLLEGGLSRLDEELGFMGGGRVGVSLVEGSHVLTLGASGRVGSESRTTLGAEFEYLSLRTGFLGHLGASSDLDGNPVGSLGAGWQFIGVEGQYRPVSEAGDEYEWTGYAKLRVPVSWIVRVVRGPG